MPEYRKFTKDVGIVGIAEILMKLRGLILLPILTKTLGAYDYGIWSQVTVTIYLLAPFVLLGLPSAMNRFLPSGRDKKEIQEGFFSSLFISLISGIVICLLLFFSADFLVKNLFKIPEAILIFQITAIIIPFWALDTLIVEYFRAVRDMFKYSVLQIILTFSEIILVYYVVLFGSGVLGAVFALLTVRFIFMLLTLYYTVSRIGMAKPNPSKIREYLRIGIPLVPTNISYWIINASDRYILGFFIGSVSVGIYSVAYNIGMVILMFSFPFITVLLPTLSKLWEDGKITEIRTHYKYSLKYFLTLAIPSVFGISILSRSIIYIFTSSEFTIEGSLVLPFIALSTLFAGVRGIYGNIFVLTKQTKLDSFLWFIGAAVNIVLNILLIPLIGILGAAISTLISFSIMAIGYSYAVSRKIGIVIDWLFIAKSITASIIMTFFVWVIDLRTFPEILLSIAIGALIYFVVLILLKSFDDNEIDFFSDIVRSKIKWLG